MKIKVIAINVTWLVRAWRRLHWVYRHVGYFFHDLLPSVRRRKKEELEAEATRLCFEFLSRLHLGRDQEAYEEMAHAMHENRDLIKSATFQEMSGKLGEKERGTLMIHFLRKDKA